MNPAPRISVVTVVRNGAPHLARAMDSVLAQTGIELEYLVVDGGSDDGSVEIIRSKAAGLAWWVSEPDQGISDAFNKGLARATGELVLFLNADDWYEPGALARIAGAWVAAPRPPAVLYGDCLVHGVAGRRRVQADHLGLHRDMTLCHPSLAISVAALQRHGGFRTDFRLAMDYELLLRLLLAGESFARVDAALANFTLGGISGRQWRRARREGHLARRLHCPRWWDHPRLAAQLIRGQIARWIGLDPLNGLRMDR